MTWRPEAKIALQCAILVVAACPPIFFAGDMSGVRADLRAWCATTPLFTTTASGMGIPKAVVRCTRWMVEGD